MTCVKGTSSYTVREFDTFWIKRLRENKMWGIAFWALSKKCVQLCKLNSLSSKELHGTETCRFEFKLISRGLAVCGFPRSLTGAHPHRHPAGGSLPRNKIVWARSWQVTTCSWVLKHVQCCICISPHSSWCCPSAEWGAGQTKAIIQGVSEYVQADMCSNVTFCMAVFSSR